MTNFLGDKIIDDQGNVRTIAGGQDAKLYYIDLEGNRKKYLIEGEGGGTEGPDLSNYEGEKVELKTTNGINLETTGDAYLVSHPQGKDQLESASIGLLGNNADGDGQIWMYGKGRINLQAQNIKLEGRYKNGGNSSTLQVTTPFVDFSYVANFQIPSNTYIKDRYGFDANLAEIIPIRDSIYPYNYVSVTQNNKVWMMPFDQYTSNFQIGFGTVNNCMIIFNTDPDNDFNYSFSFTETPKINKPFNFERGKTYVIAYDNNCVFWTEVVNYE